MKNAGSKPTVLLVPVSPVVSLVFVAAVARPQTGTVAAELSPRLNHNCNSIRPA
jgi:hypothetical protein